jgi:undecaprenyl-diphosphatase
MRLTSDRIALHLTVLALWLAVCAAFFTLARWVDGTYYLPFDKRPSIWAQDIDWTWADRAFRFVNHLGELQWIAVALVVLFGLLVVRGRLVEAAIVLGAGAMRYPQLVTRELVERPFSWDEPPEPVRVFPNADSFPSGHVMGETLVYGLIFAFAPRVLPWWPAVWIVRLFCLFVIVAGGPARLYTGAHWLSDVIGALLLAAMYVIPALWFDSVMREREESKAVAGELRAPSIRPSTRRHMLADDSASDAASEARLP